MFGIKKEMEPAVSMESEEDLGALSATARCVRELGEILLQKRAKGAVLKLYLENFKQFNDTFGHDYGELLLGLVSDFLSGLPEARILRYSGIEFLIVLERHDFTRAEEVARTIQDRFEEIWRIEGMDYVCSASVGMVIYPDAAETAEDLLKGLDYAVTEASQKGQNALAVFNSELQKKLIRRRAIAKLLRESLEKGEIEVRYRPTLRMEDGIFSRVECYMRLLSPELGPVGASEFLPVAEDSGLICAVDRYTIRTACDQIRTLLDAGVSFESIAVPVSPVLLLQDAFCEEMRGMLEERNIPAKKLAFEISESALVNVHSRVNVAMQDLAELGIEFVLNEFGTGYSGISNILDLPVDVVKLERMFVWQLETNPKSACLIKALIDIATGLDLKLIAEGVETDNQSHLLKQFDCPYEQGFYFSATVDASELRRLLGQGPGKWTKD